MDLTKENIGNLHLKVCVEFCFSLKRIMMVNVLIGYANIDGVIVEAIDIGEEQCPIFIDDTDDLNGLRGTKIVYLTLTWLLDVITCYSAPTVVLL